MRQRLWPSPERSLKLKPNLTLLLPKHQLHRHRCQQLLLLKKAFLAGSKVCWAVRKRLQSRFPLQLLKKSKKTTVKAMPGAKPSVTLAVAIAVAVVITAGEAVAAMSAVSAVSGQKVVAKSVLKAEAMNAVNVAPRRVGVKHAAMDAGNNAMSSVVTCAANNAVSRKLRARNNAKRARHGSRAKRVSLEKAAVQTAHARGAVIVRNAVSAR